MPVPKRRAPHPPARHSTARAAAPTAAEMLLADRIARARAASPPRDPTGKHHNAIAEIAREAGRDVADLLDEWDERATVREYDGGTSRDEAERLAAEDVRTAYQRQRRFA